MHEKVAGYLDECIRTLVFVWGAFMTSPVSILLGHPKYGKADTLGIDAIPEMIICNSLQAYDPRSILVSEEIGVFGKSPWPTTSRFADQPAIFFCDPTDGSTPFEKFIRKMAGERTSIQYGQIMSRRERIAAWEQYNPVPASISGAYCAITCLWKGKILFTVLLNYITETLYVASEKGIFQYELPDYNKSHNLSVTHSTVQSGGTKISFLLTGNTFSTPKDCFGFAAFLGNVLYLENFGDTGIFQGDYKQFLRNSAPGGPSRVLYLSGCNQGFDPIGFILANGEKISEWIHWFAFAEYSGNSRKNPLLRVFEVQTSNQHIRDGASMSPLPENSFFQQDGHQIFLDLTKLNASTKPNAFRSTILVTPRHNESLVSLMQKLNFREIELS